METVKNALGQEIGFPVAGWSGAREPARAGVVGRYCRLEVLEASRHAAELFEAFSQDKENRIWTYLGYGPFAHEREFNDWAARMSAADDLLFFAVIDAARGSAVGVASYLRMDQAAGSIEVGHINFSPALQKTIAASEAMYLMMRRVFEELGYRRYEWKCDALNARSRAAALRLGFTYEGTFRQATTYKGRNRDTAWFSIIDKEWPQRKEAFERWLCPSNFDEAGRQREPLFR